MVRWSAKSRARVRTSDKCIANCRCEVLNAAVAREGASRDGGAEEDKDEVKRNSLRREASHFVAPAHAGISSPMTSRWRNESVIGESDSGPNGSIMSLAEIIEREIVRPIFPVADFRGEPIFRLVSKAHRALCRDVRRSYAFRIAKNVMRCTAEN